MKWFKWFIYAILLVTLGFVLAAFWLNSSFAQDQGSATRTSTRFILPAGASLTTTIDKLAAEGFITNRYASWYHVLRAEDVEVQAGVYSIPVGTAAADVWAKLTAGKVVPPGVKVTFPEGYTIDRMAKRLTENGLPGDAFRTYTTDPKTVTAFRNEFAWLPTDLLSLEGYLFPDTYIFPEASTPELIVRTVLRNTEKQYTPYFQRGLPNNLSFGEFITLASLVEGEVRSDADRRMVADVFLRRLADSYPLQSCATLQYILKEDKKQFSIADTKIDSKYNTYQVVGLPPGPVDNPGKRSLEAVLNRTPNEAYFFLSVPATGETIFSKTFEEHLANKAKYGL